MIFFSHYANYLVGNLKFEVNFPMKLNIIFIFNEVVVLCNIMGVLIDVGTQRELQKDEKKTKLKCYIETNE